MKKNIQINLYGTLYNIDEDAYQLLENYLESMKRYFSRQEGGAEIADDIEHRVAELLWARKEKGMEAVSNDIIREIIAQIGNPEEIAPEETSFQEENEPGKENHSGREESSASEDWQTAFEKAADGAQKTVQDAYDKLRNNTEGKKLFRNPNDKVLGGVCSGLAQYFGGDVVLWRVILAALFVLKGFGLILYIILWIVLPYPITPEDYLRMKGVKVTPENLNSQILQENPNPLQKQNSVWVKILFALFVIFVCVPAAIAIMGAVITTIAGVSGGFIGGVMGMIGSIIGALFSIMGDVLGNLWGPICSSNMSHVIINGNVFSGPLFISGIAMLVIAFVLIIYSIIHCLRANSKPLSLGACILIGLTILACIILGSYNLHVAIA